MFTHDAKELRAFQSEPLTTTTTRDGPDSAGFTGLARCSRCNSMYEFGDGQACRSHTGEFASFGRVKMWTCCSNYEERAPGCRVEPKHTRCMVTDAALQRFPQSEDGTGLRRRGAAPEEAKEEKAKPGGPPPDAIKYTCGVGDSLQGVALRHGMRVAEIKRWNKLLSGSLYAGLQIYVRPPPPSERQRVEAVRAVMRRAPCTEPEASFYLDEHGDGNDVEAALAALAADAQAVAEGAGAPAAERGDAWVMVDTPPRYDAALRGQTASA
jgi:LysM repeat protein|eukprot:Transcript_5899.p1 GENE.Transcript_5899~~Transcript_5899.p1  ORF type:complete len:291 (-),score=99.15 Transcript_5899:244-1047(-)